jgi:ATP-binding cassette subfamily C protein CydC
VRFRYSADGPLVLDGLSLEVPPATRIAIVGPTGAGKSTLVSLLLRFWEYQGGSIGVIEAGGAEHELRELRGDDARGLFSVVPQLPYLFHATVRENLLIAAEGPNRGNDALSFALKVAQLEELVSRLPGGLDTVVGESGSELSVGEVKRIAVARALLKEAPVYVLDEPTEGLDDGTANAMVAALAERLRGKTLVVISHLRRDLDLVDRVVELPRLR